MKNSDRYLFSTLGNLERKIERVKEDHDTSQNLEEVKKILSKYNYQERDIEESYCLLKLYGYTLPDVEDSKVSKILKCFIICNTLVHLNSLPYNFLI